MGMTDHDLLTDIHRRVKHLETGMANHKAHHEKIDNRRWQMWLAVVIVILTGAMNLVVAFGR